MDDTDDFFESWGNQSNSNLHSLTLNSITFHGENPIPVCPATSTSDPQLQELIDSLAASPSDNPGYIAGILKEHQTTLQLSDGGHNLSLQSGLENLSIISGPPANAFRSKLAEIHKQTKDGLKCATDDMVEIKEALKIACIAHGLTLAQVWIAHEDSNHVPHSSSLEGKHMKQMIALKMIGCCSHWEDYDFKDYNGTCDMLSLNTGEVPLNIAEGLAWKTLQNYEPQFCRNIYGLDNKLPPEQITNKKHSCLVICLKSTKNDVDYGFGFLWLHHGKYTILIEALILTLQRYLPNFKFACDGALGKELCVVEVGNSSKAEIGRFNISKGAKLSPIPETLEKETIPVMEQCISPLTEETIKQQHGRPQKEAAKNLGVSLSTLKRKREELRLGPWEGAKGVKRKVNHSYKDQSDMINGEDNRAILGPLIVNGDTITIKAYFTGNTIKIHLPCSRPRFKDVEKKIGTKLKLNPGSFKLTYRDEDEESISFLDDADLMDCIKILRSGNSTAIKLFVEQPM